MPLESRLLRSPRRHSSGTTVAKESVGGESLSALVVPEEEQPIAQQRPVPPKTSRENFAFAPPARLVAQGVAASLLSRQ